MTFTIDPPIGRPIISAVTGTNGKTSVATATRQVMNLIGWRAAGYDSTGITDVEGVAHKSNVRRSPDYLPDLIRTQVAAGAQAISLEAFVGILADGLFEHVEVDTAVSTGLERDHIDVHRSVEGYWNAKLRLFAEYLRPDGVAIIATNSAQGDLVRDAVARRGIRLVTVGEGGDIHLDDAVENEGRMHGDLRVGAAAYRVSLPTVHTVAVTNLLLASAAVIGAGGDPGAVADALARVEPPPGRLQVIAQADGVTAMVDTAHNPGALRTALRAARARTERRVILVFGAGGERDRGKRAQMGAIAAELADVVILTDDNPRREPPERIRAEIRVAVPDCVEIPARKDAILAAVHIARAGDLVLVAGKGDESDQIVGTQRLPHDDREILRQAMS
ncbi:Mur ligase family protein [Microbacterium sp. VKM Ac-2923]|uniref:Mur ligase family protein n=1 Tax=Microbacterium sp. VKM Ac-2923 TaxID=2929476 RepID=UPI001FB4DFBD|nr:UDP-N-acetylmuramyl-tripeptide synthetase [Microbacterium sp. VKM Ac-2923]MCJ1706487.1 UDP-N-acetylmuramyl-tripeptide synthetase [Microbacterium sp. VKM Ac-2923]